MECSRLTGEHEDPCADDGANAERDQVDRAEGATEGVLSYLVGLFGKRRGGVGSIRLGQ